MEINWQSTVVSRCLYETPFKYRYNWCSHCFDIKRETAGSMGTTNYL